MTQPMTDFSELALSPSLQKAIAAMKYTVPTPIQAEAIPVAFKNRDVIGLAQTGTGKTAAFAIPIITKLEKNSDRTALILVPTRELAAQVEEVFKNLTQFSKELSTVLLIGGVALPPQIKALRKKPRIVIATPGRLCDHLRKGALSLSSTQVLVLDEADRMLDMGFAAQLNEIFRFLPKVRQTLLFSATMPPHIEKLASKFLRDPVRVSPGGAAATTSKPPAKIQQNLIQTTDASKMSVLVKELNSRAGSIIIFARTKRRTDKVARQLHDSGFQVNRIHGDRSQAQRNQAIDGFKKGKFRVLVATDIAARGIDVPHIAHVINFDLPQCAEDYVHRIGRTARAGAEGQALSILIPSDREQWREITKLLSKSGSAKPMV